MDDGINEDVFCIGDDLDRKQIKSRLRSFDHEYGGVLKKWLGFSSSSSDDDDSHDVVAGGCSGSGGCEVDGENEEEEEDEGLVDTHLKMFLENIKADGASYVLKREGRPDLKFEGMDADDVFEENEGNVEEISSDCESEQMRRRRRRGEDLDVRSQGRIRGKGVLRAGGSRNVKGNGKGERGSKGVKNVGKKRTLSENHNYGPVEEVDLTQVERKGKNVESQSKKKCLSENIMEEHFDIEYKMFFDQCELEGDRLIFVANEKRLVYGEDDNESLSDSDEVCVLDHAPVCMESNYAPTLNFDAQMEDDDLQCLGSSDAAENPLFRKAVIDILRKPFDFKEYSRLRADVKHRKPVERHVDMRSGNTSFQQSTMGKSYLDHYADLKKQLVAFKNDDHKKLNILRGFFFYLERMADDGKFKPWLDDSCLAVIPGTG